MYVCTVVVSTACYAAWSSFAHCVEYEIVEYGTLFCVVISFPPHLVKSYQSLGLCPCLCCENYYSTVTILLVVEWDYLAIITI